MRYRRGGMHELQGRYTVAPSPTSPGYWALLDNEHTWVLGCRAGIQSLRRRPHLDTEHTWITSTPGYWAAGQVYSRSVADHTWILGTHVVVPQRRRRSRRRHVSQSNDEVIRAITWTEKARVAELKSTTRARPDPSLRQSLRARVGEFSYRCCHLPNSIESIDCMRKRSSALRPGWAKKWGHRLCQILSNLNRFKKVFFTGKFVDKWVLIKNSTASCIRCCTWNIKTLMPVKQAINDQIITR